MTNSAIPPEEKFAITTSRGFTAWLARSGGSIAFSTYQGGKLFFLGTSPSGALTVFERNFERAMGLAASADGQELLLATRYQLFRFRNALPAGAFSAGGHDRLFVPRQAWITGDLDIHDLGFDAQDRPVFVNTLFNCLAAASDGYSFRSIWQPGFIDQLVAEDRCHLNGLAMENGQPHFVTAVSRSNVSDGWRDRRRDGGVVIDVATGRVLTEGLSMPHSPRLHDGQLYVLNSGEGAFGRVDLDTGTFTPLAFCPGFARGMTFVGGHAVVGLSLARENRTFQGLGLDAALIQRDAQARCGLLVIDPVTGQTLEWVRIEGVVRELYDVAFIAQSRSPSALGFKTDEITRVISVDDRRVGL